MYYCRSDRGCIFIPTLLRILKEVVDASLPHATTGGEHIAELLDNVQKIFQKILECMALGLRRHREEGIQVFVLFKISQLDGSSDSLLHSGGDRT